METLGTRVKAFITYKGLKNKEFIDATKIDSALFYRILGNEMEAGSQTMRKINSAYSELNLGWLLTGNGEMLIELFNVEEQELLKHFREVSGDLIEKTDFTSRVRYFWREFQESQVLMDRIKLNAPELDEEKKKLLKWHLWEFQERRRWLAAQIYYIATEVPKKRLLTDTEFNDFDKQVEGFEQGVADINQKIRSWYLLESEVAKKIMEE